MTPKVKRRAEAAVWLPVMAGVVWAFGALWFDFPAAGRGQAAAWLWLAGVLGVVWRVRPRARALGVTAAGLAVVLGWWWSLRPSDGRDWLPEVARKARVEIQGDEVVLHEVRHFDYRSATEAAERWETRRFRLSDVTAVDVAIDHWGSPWMAHPIMSFQVAGQAPVAFSIETRKERGEKYSAIGGLYRQYELIYIAADERDVLRLRTNFRKGEEVRLYRLKMDPEQIRERFLEYARSVNELAERPRWYNAVTTNCTTNVREQHPASERAPWDWRMLANGKMDEMLYEMGLLETEGLGFAELRERALINEAARAADGAADFSARIREGRPGFGGGGG